MRERTGGEGLEEKAHAPREGRAEGHRRGRSCCKRTLQGSLLIFSLKNSGNGNAIFFSGGGIQAEEQSLKGRSLVLYMLSGHGRQPVSSMWSLGEMGQRERHLRVFNSLRPRRLKARSLESLPRQLSRLPSGSLFTSSPPCQIQMSGNPHTHTQPSVTAPGNCSESRFPALSIPAPQHSLLLPR